MIEAIRRLKSRLIDFPIPYQVGATLVSLLHLMGHSDPLKPCCLCSWKRGQLPIRLAHLTCFLAHRRAVGFHGCDECTR